MLKYAKITVWNDNWHDWMLSFEIAFHCTTNEIGVKAAMFKSLNKDQPFFTSVLTLLYNIYSIRTAKKLHLENWIWKFSNAVSCTSYIKYMVNRESEAVAHHNEDLKSVNLQHNTLGCLDDGTNQSSTKRLMFQLCIIFFMISCNILCKNPFNLFSYFSINLQKWK